MGLVKLTTAIMRAIRAIAVPRYPARVWPLEEGLRSPDMTLARARTSLCSLSLIELSGKSFIMAQALGVSLLNVCIRALLLYHG